MVISERLDDPYFKGYMRSFGGSNQGLVFIQKTAATVPILDTQPSVTLPEPLDISVPPLLDQYTPNVHVLIPPELLPHLADELLPDEDQPGPHQLDPAPNPVPLRRSSRLAPGSALDYDPGGMSM